MYTLSHFSGRHFFLFIIIAKESDLWHEQALQLTIFRSNLRNYEMKVHKLACSFFTSAFCTTVKHYNNVAYSKSCHCCVLFFVKKKTKVVLYGFYRWMLYSKASQSFQRVSTLLFYAYTDGVSTRIPVRLLTCVGWHSLVRKRTHNDNRYKGKQGNSKVSQKEEGTHFASLRENSPHEEQKK